MSSNSKVHLDFETRSTQNIGKTGAWYYAGHPDTRILCAAFAKDDEKVRLITREQIHDFCDTNLDLLREYALDKNTLFCAHNALFEYAVWHLIMVPYFGLPGIPILRWRCSAAKAAARGLPRALGQVAVVLDLKNRKTDGGRAVMLKLSKPDSAGRYVNKPELFQELYEYCVADVETERELAGTLPDLSPFEQKVWSLDLFINARGIQVDVPAVNSAVTIAGELQERLTKELIDVSDGMVDSASKHLAVKRFLASQGLVLKSVDKQNVKDALAAGMLSAKAKRVLEIKQELGRSSLAKYDALARSTCPDGRVRDILMYHGAGTGRWSGKVVQMQNLPARGFGEVDSFEIAEALHKGDRDRILAEPSVSAALSSAIRGMFIASPGHKLIVADYSAIEARIVMWLAGDKTGMDMFANSDAGTGPEVYLQMARMLYKDDNITKENAPEKRNLGKQIILGCGYQMSADRFLVTCQGYGMDLDEGMAQKAVNFYREKFYQVTRMWTAQERSALAAMGGKKVRCGKIMWHREKQWLICTLPSGRQMCYFKPELEMDGAHQKLSYLTLDSQKGQVLRKKVYGGLLVENICQATARDIMADAMLRVHQAGHKILLTVHDEIVAEHESPDMLGFIKILEQPTTWSTGLPLKASGWTGNRYGKG